MKTFILYHGGDCWDGLAAAWVARNALCSENDIKLEHLVFIPVQYNQPAPTIEKDSAVYILDFCYPFEQLIRYKECTNKLIIIDHHKTAKEPLDKLYEFQRLDHNKSTIVFDEYKSGCRLTYEHFYGDVYMGYSLKCIRIPGIIRYIEDRDLWAWKLPNSKEVSAGLRSLSMTFETLDNFVNKSLLEIADGPLVDDGAAILRYQQTLIDSHVSHSQEVEIAGHKVLAVNATCLISEIAGKLAEGRPFGAVWFDSKDGKRVWSLRSTPDGIDVSEIAEQFGGGGHKHAAGFTEEQFVIHEGVRISPPACSTKNTEKLQNPFQNWPTL